MLEVVTILLLYPILQRKKPNLEDKELAIINEQVIVEAVICTQCPQIFPLFYVVCLGCVTSKAKKFKWPLL